MGELGARPKPLAQSTYPHPALPLRERVQNQNVRACISPPAAHKNPRRTPYNQRFSAFCVTHTFTGSDTRTMPIYEYACPDCSYQHDHLQKLADAPIAACPKCGSTTYYKKISAAGFALKGTGWYVTDFRNGNAGQKPGDKKAADGTVAAPPSGDAKSSDSAPAKTDSVAAPATSTPAAAPPPAAPASAPASSDK